MADRPVQLVPWATDDDYPAGAEPEAGTPTKVEPLSGKKAIGWRPSEFPPAQYLNWWMWLASQWIAFLSTLRQPFFLLNENWAGFRPTNLLGLDLKSTGVSLSNSLVGGENMEAGGGYRAHIPLPYGSTIRAWSITVDKTTSGANTVTAQVYKRTIATGAAVAVGTAQTNNAASPGVISLGEPDVWFDLSVGQTYFIEVTASAWAGGGIEYAYAASFTYLPPDPVFDVAAIQSTGNYRSSLTVTVNEADRPGAWARLHNFADDPASIALRMRRRVTLGPWPDNVYGVIETWVDSTEIAGLDESIFYLGLVHDEGVVISTEDQIRIYKDEDSANWMFQTSDSPAGPVLETDTGVAATGVQKIRIEIFGDDYDSGAYRATLSIDGVEVASHTTHLPAGQEMVLQAYFKNEDSVPDDKYVYLAPLTFALEID